MELCKMEWVTDRYPNELDQVYTCITESEGERYIEYCYLDANLGFVEYDDHDGYCGDIPVNVLAWRKCITVTDAEIPTSLGKYVPQKEEIFALLANSFCGVAGAKCAICDYKHIGNIAFTYRYGSWHTDDDPSYHFYAMEAKVQRRRGGDVFVKADIIHEPSETDEEYRAKIYAWLKEQFEIYWPIAYENYVPEYDD